MSHSYKETLHLLQTPPKLSSLILMIYTFGAPFLFAAFVVFQILSGLNSGQPDVDE